MRLRVTVPATSANLGPGFDCFGLALEIRNEISIDTEAEPSVTWRGEGAAELPVDGTDLVGRAIRRCAELHDGDVPTVARHGLNRIPLERGLGSSAAACVAGIALADRLLGLGMSDDERLALAVELEGHPDNAAAAFAGGLTIAFGEGTLRLQPSPELRPVVLVPDAVRVPTAEARAVLPSQVPFADAIFNAAHAAAAAIALTSEPQVLHDVLRDRLHQEARLGLVPEVKIVFDELWAAGVPVCVSGAGPSLLAFELGGRSVPELGERWRVLRPGVAPAGVTVEEV